MDGGVADLVDMLFVVVLVVDVAHAALAPQPLARLAEALGDHLSEG